MSALRQIFAFFGVEFDDTALKAGDKATKGVTESLKDLGGLLAGGVVAVGLRSFVESSEEAANSLDRYARTLGITTRDLQAWGAAAGQVGRELDDVVDAMSTVQERARDAVQDPKSDPAVQLRALGVSARDANGELKDGQTLMLEVARGMQGLGTQTDRVGAAMTLFGDVGRELLPVLQEVGEDGFAPLLERLDEAGGGLSEDFVRAGVEASRASARLDLSLQSLRSRVGVVLLPVVTRLTDGVTELVGAFTRWKTESKFMEAALVTLGTVAVGAAAKLLLPFLPAIATFAAVGLVIAGVTLVVEDLLVALDGGDSVFGRFTESMEDFFEMNREQEGIVADLAREWEGYVRTVERAIAVIGEWLGLGPSVEDLTTGRTTDPARRALQAPGTAAAVDGRDLLSAGERRDSGTLARLGRGIVGGRGVGDQVLDRLSNQFLPSWAALTTPVSEMGSSDRVQLTSQRGLQPPPSVRQEVTVNVNGGDPREVERAVRREMDRQLRETADAFSQGGEEL